MDEESRRFSILLLDFEKSNMTLVPISVLKGSKSRIGRKALSGHVSSVLGVESRVGHESVVRFALSLHGDPPDGHQCRLSHQLHLGTFQESKRAGNRVQG